MRVEQLWYGPAEAAMAIGVSRNRVYVPVDALRR